HASGGKRSVANGSQQSASGSLSHLYLAATSASIAAQMPGLAVVIAVDYARIGWAALHINRKDQPARICTTRQLNAISWTDEELRRDRPQTWIERLDVHALGPRRTVIIAEAHLQFDGPVVELPRYGAAIVVERPDAPINAVQQQRCITRRHAGDGIGNPVV